MTSASAIPIHDDRKLPALTGLRFFAAMAVLISHFSSRGLIWVPPPVIEFLDGGRTAVALFFVLSGFILTYNYSTLSGRREVERFYVNRVARIYPMVLLALAIGVVGVALTILSSNGDNLRRWYGLSSVDPVALIVSFLSQVTVTTGWLPTARLNQPWNGPAWSIACEMFFYLLFPAVIIWARGRGTKIIAAALVLAFAAQVLLVLGIWQFAPTAARGFLIAQFPLSHLFDFLIGVGAGLFFLRGGRAWFEEKHRRNWALVATLIGIVVISFFRPVDPTSLVLTPFFAALVVALAVAPRARRSLLSRGPLLLLGEASFALYLIHVPLLNLYSLALAPFWLGWILVALTIAVSIAIFKIYETPSRSLVKRVLGRRGNSENVAQEFV